MKKIILIITILLTMLITACFDNSSSGSNNNQKSENTIIGEKTYIVNPLPIADFYYFTESGKFYKYNGTEIIQFSMTVTIKQDGQADITQNIIPVEFYRLGLVYNFQFEIEGETYLYNQIQGTSDIYIVESLYRHPDIVHKEMNNGRFSITTNIYDIYTVSDIRNLTLSSGITRTLMCTAYYLGSYNIYGYGLWFVALDDGLTTVDNGLWYYPENDGSKYKIINEKGEMW